MTFAAGPHRKNDPRESRSPRSRKQPSLVRMFVDRVADAISLPFCVVLSVLLLALTLSGSSQMGHIGNTVLYVAGIVALGILLPTFVSLRWTRGLRYSVFCLALLVATPALQLIPLPGSFTALMPGREALAELERLIPGLAGARPLSLSPVATVESFLYLLPPAAIFIGTTMTTYAQRRVLTLILLSFAFASVMLGVMQLADGEDSALRPYTITSKSSAVGMFANANHLAALLYSSILLSVAWITSVGTRTLRPRSRRKTVIDPARLVVLLLSGAFILVAVLGAALTRSRAGAALSGAAVILSLLNVYFCLTAEQRQFRFKFLLGIAVIALLIAAFYTIDQFAARFAQPDLFASRRAIFSLAWHAAKDFFPFGSGSGTAIQVYQMYERPETIAIEIINRAHNEYLEWLLEAGALSAGLMLLGLLWIVKALHRSWFQVIDFPSVIDKTLVRGASLVPLLLLLHSAVDYPLRIGAIAALFAFCCAMTIEPIDTLDSETDSN